jgi:ABC-type uncharacterized transport system fused permease/ATPase subunit
VALIACCIAVSSALAAGAAPAAATTPTASSSSAFCQAYNSLSSYKGNTSSISGFRSSLRHLRTLVAQVEKTAPPSVKSHLAAFLKDEAQLQTLADKSSSFNALSNSAQAQAISGRLQSDGEPVDTYASSHCKG